jgi:hypothetical protein
MVGVKAVTDLRDHAAAAAAVFDASVVLASEAVAVVAELGEAQRFIAGMQMAAAARVAEAGVWKAKGHASAADWLAKESGSSVGEAAGVLDTARKLEQLPATRDAVREGRLSPQQARAVAGAASVAPGQEQQLLDAAARSTFQDLKAEAQRVQAAATDDSTRERRNHRKRSMTTGTNGDGAWWLSLRGTGLAGARFLEQFLPYREARFAMQRTDGVHESYENRCFDAAMDMFGIDLPDPTSPGPSSPKPWRRGRPGTNPDGRPVPVGVPAATSTDGANESVAGDHDRSVSAARSGPHGPGAPPTAVPELFDPVHEHAEARPTDAGPAAVGPPDARPTGSTGVEITGAAPTGKEPAAPRKPSSGGPTSASPPGEPPLGRPPPCSCGRAGPGLRLPRGAGTKVIARIDLPVLSRGYANPGEICEIVGLGQIPVTAIDDLLSNAFVCAVLTDGIDVHKVAHLGRGPNAHQRTALESVQFRCTNIACNHTVNIEVDHRTQWATNPETTLTNLDPLCSQDHARKTHQGWALEPGKGRRRFLPPRGGP